MSLSLTRFGWGIILLPIVAFVIFGKGITYIQIGGLYWNELCLALGASVVLMANAGRPAAWLRLPWPCWLLLGLVVFTGLRALLSVGHYGITALRDYLAIGYAVYLFLPFLIRRMADWRSIVWVLATAHMASMCWFLVTAGLGPGNALVTLFPAWPGASQGMQLLENIPEAGNQHAALGALFLIICGVSAWFRRRLGWKHLIAIPIAIVVLLWVLGHPKRAPAVGLLACLGLLPILVGGLRGRPLFMSLGTCITLGLAALAAGFAIITGRLDDRLTATGTESWRLGWWQGVASGMWNDAPLWGLGFGFDLLDLSPYKESTLDYWGPVRSPHNIVIIWLARLGIVGLTLLAICLAAITHCIFRLARKSMNAGDAHSPYILFLILIPWFIFINSQFSVLVEGPVNGPLFWLSLGLLLVYPRLNREMARAFGETSLLSETPAQTHHSTSHFPARL